jgi:mRNA interferase MazF
MVKGEIWWAELPQPRGSEPAKTRPVLVVQSDEFNTSKINTVICAVITSNLALANVPPNWRLEIGDSKLKKTSAVNFSQLVTVDRQFFKEWVTMLPKSFLPKIDGSLMAIFGIRSLLYQIS